MQNYVAPVISAKVKKILPIIVASAIFMQMLDATILNTALPSMARDLNESPLNMQSAIISYALTVALLIPVSGYFADRYGTKKTFMVAVVLFCIGSLLCALSPTLSTLVFSRVIQGIGGAMMTPIARLTLIKAYDRSEFLSVINYATMPALIGPIIGPLVGGYLVEVASWHWVFLINIPIGVLGLISAYKFMPDFREPEVHMDFLGYALFGSAVVLLSLGLEFAGQGAGLPFAVTVMAIGLALLAGYVRYAERMPSPLFSMDLFKIRTFRIGIWGNLVTRVGISAMPLLLPLLLQVAFLNSASTAGWMLAPMAIAALLIKPFIKPLLTRYSYRKVLVGNTLFIGFMSILLALPTANTPLYYLIPLLFVMGASNSIQFTAMNTISLSNLRPHQASSGNSLVAVNQQLSIGFGIAIGAACLRFFDGQNWVGDTHTAFRITFVILGLATMASSLVFSRLHQKDGDNLAQKH
ncbi:DHA2 family efflux MFS transporter permease subunit [Neisseriaceae bacterium CLB008]|nr:DHA2 family efflux MFS transporter permease subunit [Neisseriaceae bacterium]